MHFFISQQCGYVPPPYSFLLELGVSGKNLSMCESSILDDLITLLPQYFQGPHLLNRLSLLLTILFQIF